jgi:DNA-directed RNA polymerase subunit RPC12/RpoP
MEPKFTRVGSYQYSSEAIIVKGKLEAEGIEVFMADNFTIDTDPLVSNAIGGVKLFVRTEQADEAFKILNDISRYSVDENGNNITCPNCNSQTAELITTVTDKKSLLAFLFGFGLFGTLPLYTKYKYRCSNCGHEFE